MTNKTYRLYPKAVHDLENIYSYSMKEFGFSKAEDYIRQIDGSFQNIATNPDIARKCDYIRPQLRAFNVGLMV